MRGTFYYGCSPGVIFYNSKNGPILLNEQNKEPIREDLTELLNTIGRIVYDCLL